MKGGKSKAETRNSELSVTKKPAKDPSKPKKPVSAFLVFMEDFRETFKKDCPKNKSVAFVSKACGEKWRSLPESEKDLYVSKSDKRKYDYEMYMRAQNKKLEEGTKKKGRILTSLLQRLMMSILPRIYDLFVSSFHHDTGICKLEERV